MTMRGWPAGSSSKTIVGQMGVAGDYDVDLGVEGVIDGNNRPGDADAGVHITGRRCLRAAFVQEDDDGLDALLFQDRHECIGGRGFVEEVPALDPGGGDQRVGGLERHADEGDIDAVNFLDPVGRQGCFAGGLVDDVGSKPLEVSAGVRLAREVAAIDGMAAAVLHAQQFGDALVELVVAHAGNIEMHRVERFDGWFVVEEPGKGGRTTDEITRGDGQAVLVALTQLGELGGEVLGTTGGNAIDQYRAYSPRDDRGNR